MGVGSLDYIGFMVLRTLNGWLWILAILGFGAAHLDKPGPVLGYVGPAVLPFYIPHRPLIVVVGYVTRDWRLPIPVMYLIVSPTVLAVSLCAYKFAIRRFGIMRLLLGLGHARSTPPSEYRVMAVH